LVRATAQPASINRTAFDATVHCLTGCAIGETLGLVIATALGWHDLPSVLIAIALAFAFVSALTIRPLIAGGLALRAAARTAVVADTISITVMELVDTAIVLAIPGAMAAGLVDPLFWGSLATSLAVAIVVALPVNRWLVGRGLGTPSFMARTVTDSGGSTRGIPWYRPDRLMSGRPSIAEGVVTTERGSNEAIRCPSCGSIDWFRCGLVVAAGDGGTVEVVEGTNPPGCPDDGWSCMACGQEVEVEGALEHAIDEANRTFPRRRPVADRA
jgi:hypothetical protein